MTNLSQYKQDVLAEFDKNFPVIEFRDTGARYACREFILKVLDTQLEKIRKGMPKEKKVYEGDGERRQDFVSGYNTYHDEMIKLLNS